MENEHRSFECKKYKTVKERKAKLGTVCFICLKPDHKSPDCPTVGKYKCYTCESEKHHSALCHYLGREDKLPPQNKKAPKPAEISSQEKTEPETFICDAVVSHAYDLAKNEFQVYVDGATKI